MKKVCTRCEKNKDFKYFPKEKKGKYGLGSRCKKCISDYSKERYEKKKEHILEVSKKYRKSNPDKILDYRDRTKEVRKKQAREYKENHREEIREYQKKYRNEKRKSDPKRMIRDRFSCLMRNHMTKYITEGKGGSSWTTFVDYGADDLIEHLGDNAFKKGYEIDHIIPVSLYDFKVMGDEEFRRCWGLRNLRVISKEENVKKGNDLDMNLIKEFEIEDLLPMRFSEA